MQRAGLLPAYVEIMLGAGAVEDARGAQLELEALTEGRRGEMLGPTVAHTRGAVALVDGDAGRALAALREANRLWQELGARYESARTRELIGVACLRLGDDDAGRMELESARDVYEQLGAVRDAGRVRKLVGPTGPAAPGGLTARELEIVRLVATGRTNRAIGDELVISEKTVARHLSNVFSKLGVSSRSALTAFAYEHELL
jgi:DNA-binding CsgD family transcriptional regulator